MQTDTKTSRLWREGSLNDYTVVGLIDQYEYHCSAKSNCNTTGLSDYPLGGSTYLLLTTRG